MILTRAIFIFFFLFLRLRGIVAARALDLVLPLFHEIFAALGTLFARGEIPTHKFAFGIFGTTVINFPRLALHALGGRAAHGAGARKFRHALVGAALSATEIFAVFAHAVDHEFAAFGAFFGGNFALERQNGGTFGIVGASEEFSVLAALDDHVRAAFGAFGSGNFHALALDI